MSRRSFLRILTCLLFLVVVFSVSACTPEDLLNAIMTTTTTTSATTTTAAGTGTPSAPTNTTTTTTSSAPTQPSQPSAPTEPTTPPEPPAYYTITWKDELGETLGTTRVFPDDVPSYAYQKQNTSEWEYLFKGWSDSRGGKVLKELPAATEDATYYASVERHEAGSMKVEFFGTSHGTPSDIRYSSSVVIEMNGSRYIFDVGAPVADILIRKHYDYSTIRGVFITHMHGDHVNGLPNLVDVSQWKSESKYTVYLPEQGGIDMLNAYNLATNRLTSFYKNRITLSHYEAGLIYEDENLKVTAVRVDHVKGMDTYGFLVEGGGKRVYITGDMSYDMHDFPELLYDIELDMIITELAHQQPADMLEHLKKCNIKTICLTHISPLEKGQQLIDMSGFLGNRMIIVEDNQILYP